MKEIIGFVKQYARDINKPVLLICTLVTAFLVWLNYSGHLEYRLTSNNSLPWPNLTGHYIIFAVAFLVPYSLLLILYRKKYQPATVFFLLALIAPLIFALKVSMDTNIHASNDLHWNQYWNIVFYWPPRLLVTFILLLLIHHLVFRRNNPTSTLFGLAPKRINWTPYWLMLLIMVPLITAASTQPDFLAAYPKMREILPLPHDANPSWWYKLLFEISYGTDFFSIELFFRGFLVIGFMKWMGKDAILPMACFYCTIHFGKPLGECISSYFGGMLLGIVSYHTRSIYGGLMVHLGIAWLMELGGYFGNILCCG